eukprot:UN10738
MFSIFLIISLFQSPPPFPPKPFLFLNYYFLLCNFQYLHHHSPNTSLPPSISAYASIYCVCSQSQINLCSAFVFSTFSFFCSHRYSVSLTYS